MSCRFWVVALAFVVGACGSPSITDGAVRCDTEGLCPTGFACAADSRCYRDPGECGDGELDPGETCDPPGLCPTSCSDGNDCTRDEPLGLQESCTLKCAHIVIDNCSGPTQDGCCPAGCQSDTNQGMELFDADCSTSCGDGELNLEQGETCDPPETCRTECEPSEGCEIQTLTGSPENCNVACSSSLPECDITTQDDCCAPGCTRNTDADCSFLCQGAGGGEEDCCGNGKLEPPEICDGETCPAGPDDCPAPIPGSCELPFVIGSAQFCTAQCVYRPIPCRAVADGCCNPAAQGSSALTCQADPDCNTADPTD